MPLAMPTMSTILACDSAARAAACTAGESGSSYFVCADAKHETRSNKSNFKLRDVAVVPPQVEPANQLRRPFSGDGHALKRVTGIMKLILFTSAVGAGYFAHHRQVKLGGIAGAIARQICAFRVLKYEVFLLTGSKTSRYPRERSSE